MVVWWASEWSFFSLFIIIIMYSVFVLLSLKWRCLLWHKSQTIYHALLCIVRKMLYYIVEQRWKRIDSLLFGWNKRARRPYANQTMRNEKEMEEKVHDIVSYVHILDIHTIQRAYNKKKCYENGWTVAFSLNWMFEFTWNARCNRIRRRLRHYCVVCTQYTAKNCVSVYFPFFSFWVELLIV